MSRRSSRLRSYRRHSKKEALPSRRREMAERAVHEHGVSSRLVCEVFCIRQSCYRYVAKTDAENEEIARWLMHLTDNNQAWGFGLCFLYLRNVHGL